jgi:hypothetical protein
MDSLLDAIAAAIARAAESWLGIAALTSPIWLLAAVRIRQVFMRRRAYRDFAAAHRNLTFVGVIPSDARARRDSQRCRSCLPSSVRCSARSTTIDRRKNERRADERLRTSVAVRSACGADRACS